MQSSENYRESYSEERIEIGVSHSLREPLVFTLFFVIIGIVIQSFQIGSFSFLLSLKNFFITNYLVWFNSLGDFVDPTFYTSMENVLQSLLGNWYYFFYTGGLLSLIWALLSWLFSLTFKFERPHKTVIETHFEKSEEPLIVPQKKNIVK